ncbi:outer membrane cobalamin receptor [Rhodothalassium salexigens DSM 2132]|uniref:Outer membrane cobalamin receptor n=1 Tax=Rhodothalassium salexigens DSM 2132 TaxID=1188247 RepID=A0A4R2PSV1_RHOSA|nr:hypothetical protein [Rhodothalassium salexigens DSM 2132]TCP38184.1 outer membrane cobalamin receptor [Rhodothalassium salexigens DSM 2132]
MPAAMADLDRSGGRRRRAREGGAALVAVALGAVTLGAPPTRAAAPDSAPHSVPDSLPAGPDQPVETLEVTAPRLDRPAGARAFPLTRLAGDALARSPSLRLDDILSQAVAGFSLFRRQSSLVANPTTQGVSLRGIGPNGAGRTLVLLDGVPLNDPFGGWVYWSALDPQALGAVEVVRGGGAGGYGNQALAGTIRLASRAPEPGTGAIEARGGGFATVDVSARSTLGLGRAALTVSGRYFDSAGYHQLRGADRSPADRPAASRIGVVDARLAVPFGPDTELSAGLRWYDEARNNGFRAEVNDTRALDASLRLVHAPTAGPRAEVTAYYRTRDFAQTFAIATGSGVRQVLDQFDVPGRGAGLLAKARWPLGDALLGGDTMEWGVDLRYQDGETNERFRNLGDGFTRRRLAGGEQLFVGTWAEYGAAPGERLDLTAGVRLDHWRVFDGVRRETDLATALVLRDDAIAARDAVTLNGRVGAVYGLTPALDLRAGAYTGFRVPTINEYFRPFRVGNDITEANPGLDAERLYGAEAGVDWQPLPTLRLEAGYFRNRLDGAVGNVTIAQGPGVFPPTGFVPAGGSLSQRRNIDRIVADGVETAARVALSAVLDVRLGYQFVHARIAAFQVRPELVGNRVAQSPRHTLTGAVDWRPWTPLRLNLTARHETARFDDDRNTRRLAPATLVDLRGDYRVAPGLDLFVAVENLFDAAIETRRAGDGTVTFGQPRLVSGGVRLRF